MSFTERWVDTIREYMGYMSRINIHLKYMKHSKKKNYYLKNKLHITPHLMCTQNTYLLLLQHGLRRWECDTAIPVSAQESHSLSFANQQIWGKCYQLHVS